MSQPSYLTSEGAERLRAELVQLKSSARAKIAARLRAAIQQGDLSENADYISAKEEQSFLEGKIQELENTLKDVVIIEEQDRTGDFVEIGSTVTVQEDGETPETYFIVGPKEANPRQGKISFESPIGSALLNHSAGDTVEINTPAGSIKFTIVSIK